MQKLHPVTAPYQEKPLYSPASWNDFHAMKPKPKPKLAVPVQSTPIGPKPAQSAPITPEGEQEKEQSLSAPVARISPPTPAPQPDPQVRANYRAMLANKIHAAKRYPRFAVMQRIEGSATVRFILDENGRLMNVEIEASSGFPILDEEAIAIIKRASPFPPPPSGLKSDRNYSIPIDFSLR
jgi:protein TonB